MLASVCDGASKKDDAGFNGADTGFGRWLATVPDIQWKPKHVVAARHMLQKYRGQLGVEIMEQIG